MTRLEQFEIIEKLIDEGTVAGLTSKIAAICTIKSVTATRAGDDHKAEVWQQGAEIVLEASYKLTC